MAAPHHWPEANCKEALRLKADGLTWRQVGAVFGKSKSSAEAACRRHLGFKSKCRDYAACGEPIGIEQPEIHHHKRARNASLKLRRAIEAAFSRMPERKVREIVGTAPTPIPGTERIYRGQMAEREFARPIGEIVAPIVAGIMERSA